MTDRYFNVDERSEKETQYVSQFSSEIDSVQGQAAEDTNILIEDLRKEAAELDNLSEAGIAPSSHLAESIEVGLDSSYYELLSSSST